MEKDKERASSSSGVSPSAVSNSNRSTPGSACCLSYVLSVAAREKNNVVTAGCAEAVLALAMEEELSTLISEYVDMVGFM